MERARLPSPIVACAVGEGAARELLVAALVAEGADVRPMAPPQLATGLPSLDPCTALVYDLAPVTDASVDLIHTLRSRHPWLPILLYPPLREGVVPLILAAGQIPGVKAKGQCLDSLEPQRLRAFIRDALASAPASRIGTMVSLLITGAPPRLLAFAQVALRRLGARNPASSRTVGAIASELGMTPRTLQRAVPDDTLPPPKELLDWLTLLFITKVASWSGVSLRTVARDFRIDPNTFYRLRRRLMPDAPNPGRAQAAQEFDLVLLSFAERCRVSSHQTAEVLRRAQA